ncbi:MAG: hypothetical protein SF162_03745 [bacterium]|nr:hypothetical protein [bacterium]
MKPALLMMLLCVGFWTAFRVAAQSPLIDPDLPPEHGGAVLGENFAPDPYRGQLIQGGGPVDIGTAVVGQDCSGFTGVAPDFGLELRAGLPLLRVIFVADVVTSDPMMIVRMPDGEIRCIDNSYGVNAPAYDIAPAPAGRYTIWIGSHNDQPVYGALYITRRTDVIPNSLSVIVPLAQPTPVPEQYVMPTPIPLTYLDRELDSIYGSQTLRAGFLPDPFWTYAEAGGSLDVPAFDLQADAEAIIFGSEIGGGSLGGSGTGECAGFTTPHPAYTLDWEGRSTRLTIFFVSAQSGNTVMPNPALVVQAPDGRWHCNRSFAPDEPDPSITFNNPARGRYAIWLANETNRGLAVPGGLYITELNLVNPATTTAPGTMPLSLPLTGLGGASPPVQFNSADDPFRVTVSGGGEVDVIALNTGVPCAGYYNQPPSLTLTVLERLPFLRIFTTAPPEFDTTLVIADAQGRWYCADDWNGAANPLIDLLGGAAGELRIWVGSFDASDPFTIPLVVTTSNLSPLSGDFTDDP